MNYTKNRCRLHWACDGDHPPYVRVTGSIYHKEGGDLVIKSGPSYAQDWLTFAAAPRAPPIWDGQGERPSVSLHRAPPLQGACVTISHGRVEWTRFPPYYPPSELNPFY